MRFPPFTVTRPAIDQIEATGGCVRLELEPGGCCGRVYAWSLDAARPGDEVYGCEGAWLVVSADAGAVLDGAVVDYGAALRPPRFRVVRNPNTPERCACNRSFGRPWPGRGHPDCRSRAPMPWSGGDTGPSG